MRTTGGQTYNDAVTLGADTILTDTGSSAITLAQTVNGPFTLTVNTGGTTTFGGAVGGTHGGSPASPPTRPGRRRLMVQEREDHGRSDVQRRAGHAGE